MQKVSVCIDASYVAVEFDGKTHTLCVRDERRGILDWQKPFTVRSGEGDSLADRSVAVPARRGLTFSPQVGQARHA